MTSADVIGAEPCSFVATAAKGAVSALLLRTRAET